MQHASCPRPAVKKFLLDTHPMPATAPHACAMSRRMSRAPHRLHQSRPRSQPRTSSRRRPRPRHRRRCTFPLRHRSSLQSNGHSSWRRALHRSSCSCYSRSKERERAMGPVCWKLLHHRRSTMPPEAPTCPCDLRRRRGCHRPPHHCAAVVEVVGEAQGGRLRCPCRHASQAHQKNQIRRLNHFGRWETMTSARAAAGPRP